MQLRALPFFGAVTLGFLAAAVCFTAWSPRPANAQIKTTPGLAPGGFGGLAPGLSGGSPVPAQPLEVQALDGTHFVVATREPRLVSQVGREGSAQNMLVTVVTHYTVNGDRLMPIEHVRVPTGFRLITVEE